MVVKLPQLAEGVESGTVVAILVIEGQEIAQDQPIMELETQKAVGTIPAPQSGRVVKIHVKEGMEVSVGQVLISMDSAASTIAAKDTPRSESGVMATATTSAPAPTPHAPARTAASSRPLDDSRFYRSASGAPPPAAPSIRKMANDLGIDLTRITGSEAGGRIVLGDLRAYVQRLQERKRM
jgi:pyruvate dehydrogenase E2 component (dihydrolipoamide acetyltransferase)